MQAQGQVSQLMWTRACACITLTVYAILYQNHRCTITQQAMASTHQIVTCNNYHLLKLMTVKNS